MTKTRARPPARQLPRPRVAILGHDEQAQDIGRRVEEAGGVARFVDPVVAGAFSVDVEAREARVFYEELALHELRALYLRHLPYSAFVPGAADVAGVPFADWRDRYSAARERHAMVRAALAILDDGTRFFANGPASVELHLQKPWQLALLARAGVRVPRSLATSSEDAARAFVASDAQDIIYKPVAGGAQARLFVDDDLARLSALRFVPALFQERAIAGVEWRVYVVAGEVAGAFRVPVDDVVDARENLARAERVANVPADVAKLALRTASELGLAFTAVEMRADDAANGELVVLEANPTPALEPYDSLGPAKARGSVGQALAETLVARARG